MSHKCLTSLKILSSAEIVIMKLLQYEKAAQLNPRFPATFTYVEDYTVFILLPAESEYKNGLIGPGVFEKDMVNFLDT